MSQLQLWIAGARPKTLPAAIAPVLLGSALAIWESAFIPLYSFLALLVALSLQVGVNYSNDYSDGVRGTDTDRIGPVRLVGQGLMPAHKVKYGAFFAYGIGMLAGLALTWLSGYWVFIPIGALAVLSGWFYTGGKNPYGYLGFGEVFVFVWFGLAAVLGTLYAQTGYLTGLSWIMAIGSGGFACAMLMINNLRDAPKDAVANKRTLAVRLGDYRARWIYVVLVWFGLGGSVFIAVSWFLGDYAQWPLQAASGAVVSIMAHRPGRAVLNGADGAALIKVLADTGRAQLAWSTITALGLIAAALGN